MCVCVCTHTHIYVYTHTHTHTHMYVYIYVPPIYVCVYMYNISLAYLGHFVMVVSTLLRRYVVDIATNLESLKRRFMSRGNCDGLEQTS
jgi:hypothetical protein